MYMKKSYDYSSLKCSLWGSCTQGLTVMKYNVFCTAIKNESTYETMEQ